MPCSQHERLVPPDRSSYIGAPSDRSLKHLSRTHWRRAGTPPFKVPALPALTLFFYSRACSLLSGYGVVVNNHPFCWLPARLGFWSREVPPRSLAPVVTTAL